MSTAQARTSALSALSPLRVGVFRMLWIAGIASNIGSWMQTVGAQWLLVEQGSPASVVALVQAAAAAPVLLLAIPAGVIGEFVDRRRLLIAVACSQLIVVVALTWLTAVDLMSPPLLLTLTFLIGACSALQLPAYQAIVPDLVPAPLIQDAAALSSVGVNIARAVGPALAGLTIAQFGIAAVFLVNAASFVVFLAALLAWRGYAPTRGQPERFLDATRAGLRYVRHSGVMRSIYVRLGLFLVPANALWALLPVIADTTLDLDASGYGLLLGALGVGAVVGAFLLPPVRARLGTSTTVMLAATLFGAGSIVTVVAPALWLTVAVLVACGIAWIGVIATLNGTVQAFLPAWVRTRGLSVYQLVVFGSTTIGSVVAGVLAGVFGVVVVTAASGVAVIVVGLSLLISPLVDTARKGRSVAPLPLPLSDIPEVSAEAPAGRDEHGATPDDDAPVIVLVRYTVPGGNRDDFVARMRLVERSRYRTGARSWHLAEDRERPDVIVETFLVGSWREHVSQHLERPTQYDSELLTSARALSATEPEVEHLTVLRPPRARRLR